MGAVRRLWQRDAIAGRGCREQRAARHASARLQCVGREVATRRCGRQFGECDADPVAQRGLDISRGGADAGRHSERNCI